MELHLIIRKLREKHDLTQENIGDELGVDKTTIGRYEKDAGPIGYKELEKLASIFGMSVPEMLSWEDDVRFEKIGSMPQFVTPSTQVKILIELDGSNDSLQHGITRLQQITKAIA